jgi:N-methylhydantoinase A
MPFSAAGAELSAIDLIVHGTTTTTNAVLERQLAKTGLITTQGLSRRAGAWPPHEAAGLWHARLIHPVIPRDLRLEVPERMDARGRVLTALDEDALRAAVIHLRDQGCESLVIHFLHAYANPAHELRAGRDCPKPLAEVLCHAGPRASVGKPRIRTRGDGGGQCQRPAAAGTLCRAAGG